MIYAQFLIKQLTTYNTERFTDFYVVLQIEIEVDVVEVFVEIIPEKHYNAFTLLDAFTVTRKQNTLKRHCWLVLTLSPWCLFHLDSFHQICTIL